MCLYQGSSNSNSRYFSKSHLQRFINTHPCGHCAECIQQKRSEWYVRNYWQARECMSNHGFFVSEALTYEDGHLPHVSDFFDIEPEEANFSCVDKKGVQMFLDRLHTNLRHRYYGANFEIKHFICAEYGHDDVYYDDYGRPHEGTIRPHYHCLFYVMHPSVRIVYNYTRATKRARRLFALYFRQHRKDFPEGVYYDDAREQFFCYMKGRRVDCTKELLHLLPKGEIEVVVSIKPAEFVYEIARAWQNGNTQNYKMYARSGKPYDNPFYAQGYTKYVFNDVDKADSDLRGITNYITKYITKGDEYSARLGARAARVAHLLSRDGDGRTEKELFQEAFKLVKDKIGLFHLQSDGFGKYYLDTLDDEDVTRIENEATMKMQDAKDVVRMVPLPMYYIRKLFYRYRTQTDTDGKRHVQWYLTEYGKEQMKKITYSKIARQAGKYRDTYADMPDEWKAQVDALLDGRTFEDLMTYLLVYKGRIVYQGYDKDDALPTVEDIIDITADYNAFDAGTRDYENTGRYLVEPYHDVVDTVIFDDCDSVSHRVVKKSTFSRRWCINQDTLFDGQRLWRGYDDLLSLFSDYRAPRNDKKEKDFRDREAIVNRVRHNLRK